jgi:uncharacterized protein (DUF305 family)
MTLPRVFVHIACTAGAALAIAGCSGPSGSPAGPSLTSTQASSAAPGGARVQSMPASRLAAANYETKFMTDMIDHHMMAVMTSEVCLEEAVHEELRTMCQEIIAAQTAEIAQMQSWLQDWYGITYEPEMTPGGERMVERLAALEGAEFEIAFMEMMIKHHEGAVKEGEHCVAKAEHQALIDMCQNIIATQSAEIAQMQTWLCEWYGECA